MTKKRLAEIRARDKDCRSGTVTGRSIEEIDRMVLWALRDRAAILVALDECRAERDEDRRNFALMWKERDALLAACREIVGNGDREMFLVSLCGDGTYNSDFVFGLENARRKVCEHFHSGDYEEAQEDPMVKAYLEEFDDHEMHWGMDDGTWRADGEQFWIEVARVINFEAIASTRKLLSDAGVSFE
jgi:hypothetical protein